MAAKRSFKLEHPLERRQAEAARIREKYPDRIPTGMMYAIYKENKDEDGFLYMTYSGENTFGF
ncbi:hypothetical protein MKW92_011673 [Papaver armeniacum]|nr:hypothetical protein MKW92_011673 [Papaver armeniacum]